MEKTISVSVLSLALLSLFYLQFSTGLDTITPSKSIRDPQFIISRDGVFRLGFFGFANTSNRYVGILYNQIPVQTVVWVANRNKPLKDTSGILKLSSDDGNLVVLNGKAEILWSSNVTNLVANTATARLLDSGNLVLYGKEDVVLWESFEHPSNAFIKTMKIGTDLKMARKVQVKSWKSSSDPSDGNFSFCIEPFNIPEATIWNNNQLYYRSGPWNGHIFIGVTTRTSIYYDWFDLVADHQQQKYYITYVNNYNYTLIYYELESQGRINERYWDAGKGEWQNRKPTFRSDCDIYGKCGAFGICDSTKQPICSCLKGFEPKNIEEWGRGNWSSGCFRTTLLQCQRDDNNGQRKDGFLKMEMMKVPAFPVQSSIIYGNCVDQCLKNCSCVAYAYDGGIGCMFWNGDLIDLQKFPVQNLYVRSGVDFYLRLSSSELDEKRGKRRVAAISAVIVGIVISIVSALLLWRWMANQRGKIQKRKQIKLLFNKKNEMTKFYGDEVGEDSAKVKLLQQIPLFDFEELATATNNFHHTKKLGRGGFGIVYRGTLDDGKEIVVKRLSKASGQGLEEFTNEVVVISKLQHRNLVKLLGCCVEEEEKMLIYEYMPNKSLDAFLFDILSKQFLLILTPEVL